MSNAILTILDLRIWLHLGCSEQERHQPQCVSFDISITFPKGLKGTSSDDINDSFCYGEATKLIKETISSKPYNLIEHVASDVHEVLLGSLREKGFPEASLLVKITKLSPPVLDIHGGVSFTYAPAGGRA